MFRNVRTTDLVLLWARAAGLCSHPDCKIRLVLDSSGHDDSVAAGYAAHIVARSPAGPRGDPAAFPFHINSYENLILLCGHHHAVIDRQPHTHSVDQLRAWKAEHESWVRSVTGCLPHPLPWTAILQEDGAPGGSRIDLEDAQCALGSGNRAISWVELPADARSQLRILEGLLARTPAENRRFAIFSFGRIPLAVQLGYILGDRARVSLFHYDRDLSTWSWPPAASIPAAQLTLRCRQSRRPSTDAVIRVSLSAAIRRQDTSPLLAPALELDIAVPQPSVRWLRHLSQLTDLSRLYAQALQRIQQHRTCTRVHLFYAGPAAGAVSFGRAYNPRMNPPLQLYDYRREAAPCYQPALLLNPS